MELVKTLASRSKEKRDGCKVEMAADLQGKQLTVGNKRSDAMSLGEYPGFFFFFCNFGYNHRKVFFQRAVHKPDCCKVFFQ